MTSTVHLLPIIAAAALTCAPTAAAGGTCRVRIDVMDNLGNLVDASRLSVTVDGSGIPAAQNKMIPVPCGHYVLTAMVHGFETETQEGDIDQVDQVITVAMRIGALEAPVPSCAIVGRISGQAEVRRVRLVQLFGRYVVDVPASAARTVDFRGLQCGDYLLVAMGAKGCLGTEVVRASMAGTRVDLTARGQATGGCSTLEAPPRDGNR